MESKWAARAAGTLWVGGISWSLLTQNPSQHSSRTANHDLSRVQGGVGGGLLALSHACVTSCSSAGRTSSSRRDALACPQSDGKPASPRGKTVVSLAAFYNLNGLDNFSYLFVSFFYLAQEMNKCACMTRLNLKSTLQLFESPPSLQCFPFQTK